MLLSINFENIEKLNQFLQIAGDSLKSFRYYTKRPLKVIQNHICTYLLIDESGVPVAYGHLDQDEGAVWLGIAVAEGCRGMGLGRKMMNALIATAKEKNLEEIYLTVDRGNSTAIEFYEIYSFEKVEDHVLYYKYRLRLK